MMKKTVDEAVATLKFGIVTEIKEATLKAQLNDMDNLITDWLPVVIFGDTQDNKSFALPAIGAQVALLIDQRGEEGVCLGSIYSTKDQPTAPNDVSEHTTYKDGAVIEYNPEESTLLVQDVKDIKVIAKGDVTAEIDGNLEATVTGDTTVTASGKINLTSESDITIQAQGEFKVTAQMVSVTSQTQMTLSAPATITLQTPMTLITGGLGAGSGGSTRQTKASNYVATFHIPVRFIEKADFTNHTNFNVTPSMPDVKIDGYLYSEHKHEDSIGGETTPPIDQKLV